jgi:hypothetical protein
MEGSTQRRRPFHAILRMPNLGNQGAKIYNEVEKRLRSSKMSPVWDWY